jgi:glycogen operon protein
MTEDDWHDEGLRAFGYLLRGKDLEPDLQGQPRRDDSFLVLMNQGSDAVPIELPKETNELGDVSCEGWEEVPELEERAVDSPYEPGGVLTLRAHGFQVLRAQR